MSDNRIAACAAEIAERLRDGGTMIALTGAGISRESGVPTYRGLDGLFTKVPEDIVTPRTLHKEPQLFWEFHDALRKLLVTAKPNPAHRALADMEAAFSGAADSLEASKPAVEFAVITQNIDGLHQAAGSRAVIELHGNATRNYCEVCGKEYNDLPVPLPEMPPHCECGAVIRPDVVLFNESLPLQALTEADRLSTAADVALVIGTSVNVYPAAQIPIITLHNGGMVVEVNPDTTSLTRLASYHLGGPSGESLPALWTELCKALGL